MPGITKRADPSPGGGSSSAPCHPVIQLSSYPPVCRTPGNMNNTQHTASLMLILHEMGSIVAEYILCHTLNM